MDRDRGKAVGKAMGPRRRMVAALAATLGGTVLVRPAKGQVAPPVVGVLAFTAMPPAFGAAFAAGLRERGYVADRSVRLVWLSADGDVDAANRFAQELVRLPARVIVAVYTPAVQAAQRATASIPIVMAPAGDPVGSGLVASLARPGGNITGFSNVVAELSGKRLELLAEFVPGLSQVGLLVNGADPLDKAFVDETRAAAAQAHLTLWVHEVRNADALRPAFAGMAREGVRALVVAGNLPIAPGLVAEASMRNGLASISLVSGYAEAGGLMSYGADLGDIARRAGALVDRILRGAHVATIPVERPVSFELVVNAHTARSLGLAIPSSLRLRATRVIE